MSTLFKNSEVMVTDTTIYYKSEKYEAPTLWGTTFSPSIDVDRDLKKSVAVLVGGVVFLFIALWLGIIVAAVGLIWTGLLLWQKRTGLIMTIVTASFHGGDSIAIGFADIRDAEACFDALRIIRDKNAKS